MFAALVVCLFATLWLWRLERYFYRRLELAQPKPEESWAPEPMPADIELIAMAESETWARNQVKARLLELYAEHKDWAKVRAAYAIANKATE